jgi:chromosome segregation ATPase
MYVLCKIDDEDKHVLVELKNVIAVYDNDENAFVTEGGLVHIEGAIKDTADKINWPLSNDGAALKDRISKFDGEKKELIEKHRKAVDELTGVNKEQLKKIKTENEKLIGDKDAVHKKELESTLQPLRAELETAKGELKEVNEKLERATRELERTKGELKETINEKESLRDKMENEEKARKEQVNDIIKTHGDHKEQVNDLHNMLRDSEDDKEYAAQQKEEEDRKQKVAEQQKQPSRYYF